MGMDYSESQPRINKKVCKVVQPANAKAQIPQIP